MNLRVLHCYLEALNDDAKTMSPDAIALDDDAETMYWDAIALNGDAETMYRYQEVRIRIYMYSSPVPCTALSAVEVFPAPH
ncbi:MAG TPA: hypothetical protein VK184_17330 [Nostocaceae cyanobacterium]|nr:hypothetical protein [Nostocaceae cyanobacterium]